jgi:hypothetical protein
MNGKREKHVEGGKKFISHCRRKYLSLIVMQQLSKEEIVVKFSNFSSLSLVHASLGCDKERRSEVVM